MEYTIQQDSKFANAAFPLKSRDKIIEITMISLLNNLIDYTPDKLDQLFKYSKEKSCSPISKIHFGCFQRDEWCHIWSFVMMDTDTFCFYQHICKEMDLILQKFCIWKVFIPTESISLLSCNTNFKLLLKELLSLVMVFPFSNGNDFSNSVHKFFKRMKMVHVSEDIQFYQILNPCPEKLWIEICGLHLRSIYTWLDNSLLGTCNSIVNYNDYFYGMFKYVTCTHYANVKSCHFVHAYPKMSIPFESLYSFLYAEKKVLECIKKLTIRIPSSLYWNPKVNQLIYQCQQIHPFHAVVVYE